MTAGALSPLLGEFQIHTRDAPKALHLFVIRSTALQCSAASVPGNPESRLNIIDHYVQNQYSSFRQWGWAGKSLLLPWRQGNPKGRKRAQLLFRGPVAKRWEGSFCAQSTARKPKSSACAPRIPESALWVLEMVISANGPHSHPVIMG